MTFFLFHIEIEGKGGWIIGGGGQRVCWPPSKIIGGGGPGLFLRLCHPHQTLLSSKYFVLKFAVSGMGGITLHNYTWIGTVFFDFQNAFFVSRKSFLEWTMLSFRK